MVRKKPLKGQLDLVGAVLGLDLIYMPHKVVSRTGEAVVVLRIPEGASDIDRVKSIEAMKKLAGQNKTAPNRYYYLKRPRNR